MNGKQDEYFEDPEGGYVLEDWSASCSEEDISEYSPQVLSLRADSIPELLS